jgi:hypothetical protein
MRVVRQNLPRVLKLHVKDCFDNEQHVENTRRTETKNYHHKLSTYLSAF